MDDFIKFLKSIRLINILTIFAILVMSVVLRKMFSTKLALLFLVLAMGAYLFFILREHIDIWSPETHKILVVILVLMLAYYLGKFIGDGKYQFLAIIAVGVYMGFLFKRPEYILLISVILITGMFALINPDFLRIKGAFKLRDLLLVAPLVPLIMKEAVQKRRLRQVFGTPCAKAILGFMGLILLYVVFTVVKYSYSFNLSLRVARGYFYYIFFFPVVYFIQKKEQLDFLLKSMVVLSIIFAIMYIGQAISGGSLHIFPQYKPAPGGIGGIPLIRGGGGFGLVAPITFGLIGLAGFVDTKKREFWLIIGMALLLGAWALSFGRGGYYSLAVGVLLVLIFLPASKKGGFLRRILLLTLVCILFLGLVSAMRYGLFKTLPLIIGERAVSGIQETIYRTGTLGSRLRLNIIPFFNQVIKKHPIFGMGFLYPGTKALETIPGRTLVFADSGLTSILNTIGGLGLFAYILLHVVFVVRALYVFKEVKNPIYKGFIIGFAAMYIGGWTSALTATSLILPQNITLKAMCVGLVEVMYRVGKERMSKEKA